jgi:hypothetical protein
MADNPFYLGEQSENSLTASENGDWNTMGKTLFAEMVEQIALLKARVTETNKKIQTQQGNAHLLAEIKTNHVNLLTLLTTLEGLMQSNLDDSTIKDLDDKSKALVEEVTALELILLKTISASEKQ